MYLWADLHVQYEIGSLQLAVLGAACILHVIFTQSTTFFAQIWIFWLK